MRLILALTLLVALFSFASAAEDFHIGQSCVTPGGDEYVPGEVIVKFKDGTARQQVAAAQADLGTTEISTNSQIGIHQMRIPADKTVEEMVAAYSSRSDVAYAEPNYIAHAFMTPNDPYYTYQWHMPLINMPAAWDQSTGTGVVVAVVDCGVAYENYGSFAQAPDLAGTNFVAGWDFVNNDSHPDDDCAHGTHVAGTIAQTTNNNLGVTGVAFNCSIMPVKVLDASGSGTYTNIVNGITYAADHGAKVINMSLGGASGSTALQDAVAYAYNAGVTVVCAAGNAGTSAPQYPAAYTQCISVSAIRYNKDYPSYSSYGSTIDICAPGGDVTVDQNGDGYVDGVLQQTHDGSNYSSFGYYFYDGTSMACPHVAGVAALLIAKNGGTMTPAAVRAAIQNTAEDLGPAGWDQHYGYGLVDANAALQSISTNNPPVAAFSGTPTSGCAPLTVVFTDASTNSPTSWAWTFGDGGTSTAQNPSHTYTAAGTYTVTLTATNAYGSDGETKTGYITVTTTPTASFTGTPTSGSVPLTVTFTNASTGATSYSWTFGDGGTSTATNPSHTYTAAGTYTVALTATNSCGNNTQTRTNYITVTCTAPTANFVGSPTSGNVPLTVNFTDQSTGATSWSWTFGDGGTSTSQNPSHTYTSAGTYTVALTATNSCGSNTNTKTGYITVSASSGYATLPYSTGFETGAFDQYWTTQKSASVGRILITTANTPHTGSYHMTMDVSSNGTYSQNEAWLHLNLAGKADVELTFWWKEFSDEDHTQDGVFLSANGGSSFTKVYSLVGGSTTYRQIVLDIDQLASANGLSLTSTFVVKFQQYDNYAISTDGMAFDDISVISNDVPPVAAFSGDPTSGSAPLTVAFTDASTYNPTSWAWTFGDGGTSTAQNPSHTYTSPGTYTVTLTATNAFGSDGETKTGYITVYEPSAWVTITYDDFESGMGNYTDGGGDMSRYNSTTYAHQGSYSADIQDNSGTASSFYHTNGYNVSGYVEMEVEFWFRPVGMETGENFWVQYYNGSSWLTVANFISGTDFTNNNFYNVVVPVSSSSYNFPTNARLRFMCDASSNTDDVFIDEIEWRGTSTGGSSNALSDAPMSLPDDFGLSQNYPNPFNPVTTIEFSLPNPSQVDITVYNIAGQTVDRIVSGYYPAGNHRVDWDASRLASGVYLYRISAGDFSSVKKMILLK